MTSSQISRASRPGSIRPRSMRPGSLVGAPALIASLLACGACGGPKSGIKGGSVPPPPKIDKSENATPISDIHAHFMCHLLRQLEQS